MLTNRTRAHYPTGWIIPKTSEGSTEQQGRHLARISASGIPAPVPKHPSRCEPSEFFDVEVCNRHGLRLCSLLAARCSLLSADRPLAAHRQPVDPFSLLTAHRLTAFGRYVSSMPDHI